MASVRALTRPRPASGVYHRTMTAPVKALLPPLWMGLLVSGCLVPVSSDTGTSATTSTTSATTSTTSATSTTSTSTTSGTPSTSSASETQACSFLDCEDTPPPSPAECNVWYQDCPDGTKCMAWADDGGTSWNATMCSPIDPNPVGPGEVCKVEEGPTSGIDNCDAHSMCWNVDQDTLEGACHAFCTGTSAENATCDPGFYCLINSDSVLILCYPRCFPLLQDCPADELCIPSGDTFICRQDASGDFGTYGDPCEYANTCNAGLYCLNPEHIEGCQAVGCCTPFCDTSEPLMCPGATQECIPWYDEGDAPDGYEDVGICGIPP